MGIKATLVAGAKSLGRTLKSKSPAIMVVAGTVGLIAAGVVACKKTATELNGVLEEHKKEVQALKDIRDGAVVLDSISTEEYAATKYKKYLTHVYLRTIAKLARVYAIPLFMAALSTASIFGGFGILNKWFMGAVADTYALRETLRVAHDNVADKYGREEADLLFLGAEKALLTDTEVNENGEEVPVSHEGLIGTGDGPQAYTFICSPETMRSWWLFNSSAQVEKMLRMLETNANQMLTGTDHSSVSLYEVMNHNWSDAYLRKFPNTRNVGWMRDNPYAKADSEATRPIRIDAVMISAPGETPKYRVTFNCQGDIVNAQAAKNRQEKAEAKFNRKIQARVLPATA